MNPLKIEASGQDVLALLDRISDGLGWLGSKQMYLWRTEFSIELLEEAKNRLRDTMATAVETMEEALHNRWAPLKPKATGWLRDGQKAIERADKVLSWYQEEIGAGGDRDPTSVFLSPCEALLRRKINARAIMRMNQILAHTKKGEEEKYAGGSFQDVACRRAAEGLDTKPTFSLDHRIAALLGPPPVSHTQGSKTPPAALLPHQYRARQRFEVEDEEPFLKVIPTSSRDTYEPASPNKYRARQRFEDEEPFLKVFGTPRMDTYYEPQCKDLQPTQPASPNKPIHVANLSDGPNNVVLSSSCIMTSSLEASDEDKPIIHIPNTSKELDTVVILSSSTGTEFLKHSDLQEPIQVANPSDGPRNSALVSSCNVKASSEANNREETTIHIPNPRDGAGATVLLNSSTVTTLSKDNNEHQAQVARSAEKVQLSAFTKYRALARSQSYQNVPVVIRVKAPRYTPRSRAPIDLVIVLDLSGSMAGEKFELLKMSCMFTVHNLEATDRLSIVASSNGGLLLPLIAMSDEAKSLANSFIESLDAYGGSNLELEAAMELTYKVLRERSDDERVSSIILVTDGHLQGSVESISSTGRYPTYALGIGDDHDPQALYSFATRGHGTYSFTSHELGSIPDAMALHIGGLTSIVAQDVRISISSAHPDVRISGITCGAYDCSIDASRSGTITVNDLCGNEEKNLLVYVDVPEEQAAGIFAGTPKTKLLTVASSYRSPVTGARVRSDTVEVAVDRPGRLRGQDHSISVEVASEVTRASVFAGVKEIWREASERPDLGTNWPAVGEDLAEKLNALRDSISSTEEARAAQDRWDDLGMDLDRMQRDISRVVSMSKDGLGGVGSHAAGSVAYMLSWLSSHQWQRAATPGSTSMSRWFSFRTVRMQNMIDSVSVERAPSAFY